MELDELEDLQKRERDYVQMLEEQSAKAYEAYRLHHLLSTKQVGRQAQVDSHVEQKQRFCLPVSVGGAVKDIQLIRQEVTSHALMYMRVNLLFLTSCGMAGPLLPLNRQCLMLMLT